jgi:flagellar biosynthetic protein FlhB
VIFVLLPWYFIPAGLSFLTVLAQRGWAPSPGKIRPRLSRIDPIQNAKNKYGASGLFEFAKSFAKLLAFSTGLGLYLGLRSDDMLATLHGSPVMAATVMGRMLTELLAVIVLIAVGIGIIDMLWQRADFLRRQRMSHREVREELKRSEGDPHLKQARQQRARGRAMSQGLADVPDADVVIVNPTHVAIALKWSRAPGSAPVCVAKGVDHVALAIRDCANEHGVPVRHDPPTARALHASTEIGQEIDPDHYRVVAAAIRFSEKMRRKAGRTGS